MSAADEYRKLLDDARNTMTGKLHISPRQALDAADAAIAELEAEVECLSGSALYRELVAYKERQEARIAELEADRKNLMRRLWTSEEKAAGLETELAIADDRYKAMVKNVAGYEATIEAMRGQYTDLMIENKQLQSFIIHDGVARPYSVKALQEKLKQAEAEKADTQDAYGQMRQVAEYWMKRAERAEAERDANIKARSEVIADLQAEMAALKKQKAEAWKPCWKTHYEETLQREIDCRAELAALKARRCETCKYGQDNHTVISTFYCHEHKSQVYPTESCSRWKARP